MFEAMNPRGVRWFHIRAGHMCDHQTLLQVVGGLEEVHGEAEVASLWSGVHEGFVHIQVEGSAALEAQTQQDQQPDSHGCCCCWRSRGFTDKKNKMLGLTEQHVLWLEPRGSLKSQPSKQERSSTADTEPGGQSNSFWRF